MAEITVPKAKKEVECTSGAPACESDKIKCKVINPGQGSITIDLSGKAIADGVPLSKVSGPSTLIRKVGPVPCSLCSNPTPGGCHRCYVSFTMKKDDLQNMTDQKFEQKYGESKSTFVQIQMDHACDEWMSGPPGGNVFLQQATGLSPQKCSQPQVLKVSGVHITITASMKVYFFLSNCVREEMTITDSIKFSITGKKFSVPSQLGINVGSAANRGANSNVYGVVFKCPMMEADVFCGTCFYKKIANNSFMQPECFDADAGGATLGAVADKAKLAMTSDPMGKNPINPFAAAAEARDALAQEIEQKVQAKVPELVNNMVAVAQNLGKNKPNGVCGLGYELNDYPKVSYSIGGS
jgi:hypothetical protein